MRNMSEDGARVETPSNSLCVCVFVFDGLGYFYVLEVAKPTPGTHEEPLVSTDGHCPVRDCPPIPGYKYTTPGSCLDTERCDDAPAGKYRKDFTHDKVYVLYV